MTARIAKQFPIHRWGHYSKDGYREVYGPTKEQALTMLNEGEELPPYAGVKRQETEPFTHYVTLTDSKSVSIVAESDQEAIYFAINTWGKDGVYLVSRKEDGEQIYS